MRLENIQLTPPLQAWLAFCGSPPLLVQQEGEDVIVLRQDGKEPYVHEQVRCRGIVAAHAAEPLTKGPSPRRFRRGGPHSITTETKKKRIKGTVSILLQPEEAAEWRAWAAEHGGLAAHARWLLRARKGGADDQSRRE